MEDKSPDPSKGAKVSKPLRKGWPPFNPTLQKIVQAKQKWAKPLDETARKQGFKGWHQRGYLPHRDAPGLRQFVTFRLWDSFPASRRDEWEALLRIEEDRRRRAQLEAYLDRGHGCCWLKQPRISAIAQEALVHFNKQRYDLLAWAIMPNHVHVLFEIGSTPMAETIKNWKTHIAFEANKVLSRRGSFWQRDYWDTYMRDDNQTLKARRYTEQNPVKAGFVRQASGWIWSSAHFRNPNGELPESWTGGAPTTGRLRAHDETKVTNEPMRSVIQNYVNPDQQEAS